MKRDDDQRSPIFYVTITNIHHLIWLHSLKTLIKTPDASVADGWSCSLFYLPVNTETLHFINMISCRK